MWGQRSGEGRRYKQQKAQQRRAGNSTALSIAWFPVRPQTAMAFLWYVVRAHTTQARQAKQGAVERKGRSGSTYGDHVRWWALLAHALLRHREWACRDEFLLAATASDVIVVLAFLQKLGLVSPSSDWKHLRLHHISSELWTSITMCFAAVPMDSHGIPPTCCSTHVCDALQKPSRPPKQWDVCKRPFGINPILG